MNKIDFTMYQCSLSYRERFYCLLTFSTKNPESNLVFPRQSGKDGREQISSIPDRQGKTRFALFHLSLSVGDGRSVFPCLSGMDEIYSLPSFPDCRGKTRFDSGFLVENVNHPSRGRGCLGFPWDFPQALPLGNLLENPGNSYL